ncbi:hypothetical protein FQA39_LY05618 [Lamprigera yunnana]|nr:hypothetical protein FQA39_LY05618 [Lamprigera yunnana]
MESSITGMECNKTGGPAKLPLNPTKLLAITGIMTFLYDDSASIKIILDIVAYRLQQRNESSEMIAHVCDNVKAKIREKMNDLTKPSRRVGNKENTAVNDDKPHTTPTESADTENVTLIYIVIRFYKRYATFGYKCVYFLVHSYFT